MRVIQSASAHVAEHNCRDAGKEVFDSLRPGGGGRKTSP
jgi:hypothetical protein